MCEHSRLQVFNPGYSDFKEELVEGSEALFGYFYEISQYFYRYLDTLNKYWDIMF